eukprot:7390214-Prymnesium_polylepis.4
MSKRVLVPLGSTTSFTSLGDGRELMLARGVARGAAASPADVSDTVARARHPLGPRWGITPSVLCPTPGITAP